MVAVNLAQEREARATPDYYCDRNHFLKKVSLRKRGNGVRKVLSKSKIRFGKACRSVRVDCAPLVARAIFLRN
jgi:hypothetical protein